MTRVLFLRHAKARANERDFAAFGNRESPLIEGPKGIPRAKALNRVFKAEYGIIPESFTGRVASSTYTRPRQTLELAGFTIIETEPLLDEAVFDREGMTPEETVLKHVQEGWIPAEADERAHRVIELMRSGHFPYEVCASHGVFIASLITRLVNEVSSAGQESPYAFDEKHGYIPDFATIIPVEV